MSEEAFRAGLRGIFAIPVHPAHDPSRDITEWSRRFCVAGFTECAYFDSGFGCMQMKWRAAS